MRFDWPEFLALARDLQGRTGPGYSEEAANRTAVSRAYYAAFGYTWRFVEMCGFPRARSGTDHRMLRNYLYRLGYDDIADDINDLRIWRNQCDYEPDVPGLPTLLTAAIQVAERVLQRIP